MNIAIGAAMLVAAAAPRLLAADDLPKAETILDKYIEVTGGKAAYEKNHSEITTGTMEFTAMGLKGKVTAWRAEPDKAYTQIELEGIGKMTDGSDGKVAWASNAMQGPRIKEGAEKAQALLEARFNSELKWREVFKTAETKGMEQVDGKDCYKVVLTPAEGPAMTQYYDKESGLLAKFVLTTAGPMGEIQVESVPSDYRKEDGILMPHKMKQSVAGQEFTMTIDSVTHNPDIPKDRFDLPDEIKALVNKK
jgi:outer membrane lipoprotein-sorting protein